MIFRQIADIEQGRKTQTRRVIDPELTLLDSTTGFRRIDSQLPTGTVVNAIGVTGKDGKYRTKWRVGNVYSLVPKRGAKGVGFYRITSLRIECVQDISEADAMAEGIMKVYTADNNAMHFSRGLEDDWQLSAKEAYRVLWESINGKYPGARWADNPYVAVIGIEYVGTSRPEDSK